MKKCFKESDVKFVFHANSDIVIECDLECEQCMRSPVLTFFPWDDLPNFVEWTNVIGLDEVLLFYMKLRKKFEEPCLADIVMAYMGLQELLELMEEKSDESVTVNMVDVVQLRFH